ncbi:hypothetical protein I4U23_021242 [Adineta vaga]|nr:hypothetical protein I4U23_021242 [Adineta vaga]
MTLLGTYRQQCSQLIFRYFTSSSTQTMAMAMATVHTRARKSPYIGNKDIHVRTCFSSAIRLPWNVKWPDYKPTEYTAPSVLKNPSWADDPDVTKIKHFNELDDKIDRTSYMGKYEIEKETNRPKNPQGRTGLSGRGLLGRWGPNHAADPVVTRWAKDQKEKILEIILINRKDSGDLALPGGMVDSGESTFEAVKREFIEEALNSDTDGAKQLDKLFQKVDSIYKGYIDDPRNTDNSWMESEALNMHDETGELTKDLKLQAGDDAGEVQWIQLDRDHNLHASHETIVQIVIKKHGAYEYWHKKSNPN